MLNTHLIASSEFKLINMTNLITDMLNGSKSPVIPTPPPPSANSVFERAEFLSPYAMTDKQQNIEFGTVGNKISLGNTNNPLVTALINNAMRVGCKFIY